MPENTNNLSLLEAALKAARLSWYWVAVILAVVLTLLLFLAAYLEGAFTNGTDWGFWRAGLQPAVIVYIAVLIPIIENLWKRMLNSLQTLFPETEKQAILEKIT